MECLGENLMQELEVWACSAWNTAMGRSENEQQEGYCYDALQHEADTVRAALTTPRRARPASYKRTLIAAGIRMDPNEVIEATTREVRTNYT